MSNKLSEYDSVMLANQIEMIKSVMFSMDWEYAKAVADKMLSQASFQDSAAVLNPAYNPSKSELIRLQGVALQTLCDFMTFLKKCEELKEKIKRTDQARSEISKLFL